MYLYLHRGTQPMPYIKICPNCNQEYVTKDKRQKYCKRSCYDLKGSNNPFYGKKHPDELMEQITQKLKGKLSGEKNPFYGKTHSKASRTRMSATQKIYFQENIEMILDRSLEKLGLTKDLLQDIYNELKDTNMTCSFLAKKYHIDQRTLKKHLKRYYTDVDEILQQKQLHQGSSKQEDILYDFLCVEFGKENVQRQFRIERKTYDFLLYEKLLVEYDGYYWHQVLPNNDIIKDQLAKEKGFQLYRVKEDSNREVQWQDELKKIRTEVDKL